MSGLLKAAIACGAVPLAIGTTIYVTWRITRWDWLMAAGLFTVLGGLVVFVIGTGCLIAYVGGNARREKHRRVSLGIQTLLVGGLLLVNFPAAAYYAWSAVDLFTAYGVSIVNDSGAAIDSVVLTGPGVHVEVGPLPPGGRSHQELHFRGDGTLDFSAHGPDWHGEGQIEEYVTGNMNGNTTVRLKADGEHEIDKNPEWAD